MPRIKSKTLTGARIAQILSQQRAQAQTARKVKQAKHAVSAFRPRKKDRGTILLVSVKGKRSPSAKGKKGYLVYITKGGKKKLVKEYGEKIPVPRKISEFNIKANKTLSRKIEDFNVRRRVLLTSGKAQVKGQGAVNSTNQYDFSDSIIAKIAGNIRDTLQGQRSKRDFIISVKVLIELNGHTEIIEFSVPIAKPDHIAIRLAGIKNFVSQKFYAYMAQQLAYHGYVSSGSANHIRALPVNKGKARSKWQDRNGQAWKGIEKEQVKIKRIQWQIEQVQ